MQETLVSSPATGTLASYARLDSITEFFQREATGTRNKDEDQVLPMHTARPGASWTMLYTRVLLQVLGDKLVTPLPSCEVQSISDFCQCGERPRLLTFTVSRERISADNGTETRILPYRPLSEHAAINLKGCRRGRVSSHGRRGKTSRLLTIPNCRTQLLRIMLIIGKRGGCN